MDTRTIIAVILSIAVLYGYSLIVPQKPSSPPVQKQISSLSTQSVSQLSQSSPQPSAAPTPPLAPPSVDRDVIVDTDHYRAVFSTRGGGLRSFSLKGYRQGPEKGSPPVLLYQSSSPEDVTLGTESTPLGLSSSTIFSPSTTNLTLAGTQSATLEFTATLPGGFTVVKQYTFTGNRFPITISHRLINHSPAPVTVPLTISLGYRPLSAEKGDSRYEIQEAALSTGGSTLHLPLKDLQKEGKRYQSPVWVGFGDKYFLSALLSDPTASLRSVELSARDSFMQSRLLLAESTLPPSTTLTHTVTLYLGPKDIDILKSVGSRLEDSVDLGWFAVIAKPFLLTLKFLHRYVGNYGLAIIIITIVLKILFYPLTYKSYKSMKEMQKIQPLMEKIKEKYKDDRNAMNQEIMKLYQEHRVNPLGGCLPMVVQIPVFFALYKALMFSIELRHAPFYLWITDLSSKDPYYITPIIMGATMFIQQKMTPTSMDPTQAKIMLMLPVIFTFMFLNFPSGLVIYWLVNNILSIAQQYYINRTVSV